LELRPHEHLSLVEIQAVSDVPLGQPLFDSLLVFQSYPKSISRKEEGSPLGIPRETGSINYPLLVTAVPGRELSISISHEPERFPAVLIERAARRLRRVLEGMSSSAGKPLRSLLFETPSGRRPSGDAANRPPEPAKPEPRPPFVAPRDEVEEALAGIWSELLNVEGVGVRDDFFRLGGHSLLALRLLGRVERRFACSPPLAALLRPPTLEAMGRCVAAALTPRPVS